MTQSKIWGKAVGTVVLTLSASLLGFGLQAQDVQQSGGQPGRAVRLSYVDGGVKLSQGNQVLADPAVVNTPLFEGMQLTSGDSGKAEIQFEDGSVARLSPDSSITLVALHGSGTTGDAEILVNNGMAYFELQGGDQVGDMRVLFSNSSATASGFTVLRIDMDNPPGELAIFSGNARIESSGGAQNVDLRGGESLNLNSFQVAESIPPDSWDAWNSDRDQALTAESATTTGVPSELGQSQNPAWSDLDANGNWYNVPGQGYVWSPYDAANAGFDPYGSGNWMWTPGYGYIWASGYSWGYMPYQCGAWNFYDGFGWGWAPGFGGCNPWWGAGFYGGPNIGYAPGGYLRVTRPNSPHRVLGLRPQPLVVVNRQSTFVNGTLPLRQRNASVTIAGSTVQALRPTPSQAAVYFTQSRGIQPSGYQSRGLQNNPGSSNPNVQQSKRPGYSFARPSTGAPAVTMPSRGLAGPSQNYGNDLPPTTNSNPNPGSNGRPNGGSPYNPGASSGASPNGGSNPHPNGGTPNNPGASGNSQPRPGGSPGGGNPNPGSNARPSGGNPFGGGNSGGNPHPSYTPPPSGGGGGGGAPSGGAPSGGGGSHPSGGGGKGSGHSGGH